MSKSHNKILAVKLFSKKNSRQFLRLSRRVECFILLLFTTACSAPTHQYEHMVREFQYSYHPPTLKNEEKVCLNDPLDRSDLIKAVIHVNPSLEVAHQAWRAMLARYPQAISYDDPMGSYGFAPGTIGSKKTNFGQDVELSQKIPFPGKLALQGKMALAEAGSAKEDYEWVKIQLATMASILFDDYYAVERAIEINEQYIELLTEFKRSAEAEYAAGQVPQQTPLQGEVELARLLYDRIALATDREVVIAKINGLLHRPPSASVPSPSSILNLVTVDKTSEQLQEEALRYRPDLHALDEQIREVESSLQLAKLQYYPDFEVKGSYNSMWPINEMRTMVGVGINIPIQFNKRKGQVDEAKANLSRLCNKRAELHDQILVEVDTTSKRFYAARALVKILQERILPAAKDQLAAATSGFQTNKNSFLVLVDSEKTLKSIELQFYNAIAELHRQLALLDQAVGGFLYLQGDLNEE